MKRKNRFQLNHFFFSTRFFFSLASSSLPLLSPQKTPMLRRGAAVLLRRGARSFADDAAAAAAAAGDASGEISRRTFLEKFAPLVSSTTAPPSFPTDFLPKEKAEETAAATAGVPDKLKFSFYLPHGQPMDRQPVREERESVFSFSFFFLTAADALEVLVAPVFGHERCSLAPVLFADACSRSCCCERGRERRRERVARRAGLRSLNSERERGRTKLCLLDGVTSGGRRSSLLSSRLCSLCLLSPLSRVCTWERARAGEARIDESEREEESPKRARERES